MTVAPSPIRWDGETLELLDQTLLPFTLRYERMSDAESVQRAIRRLAVRGAPAIGIAAAYGMVIALAPDRELPPHAFMARLDIVADRLATARPTAVNLRWAIDRLCRAARASGAATSRALHDVLRAEAEALHAEDRALCRAIGEAGLPLIEPGAGILTHCNAGALAVSELGTATAPLYLAHDNGLAFRVYVDETRPLLQGSRLTAWELDRAGIDVTLICDNAAARLMAEGEIDLVIVGTDRVTRNGDVVNKIGTSALAILCRYFGIPFYVACPSSTFDPATARGADVTIEERDAEEVRGFGGIHAAPAHIKARNPAFDVTPNALVSGFVTDRGLIGPPYPGELALLSGYSGGRRAPDAPTD